MTARSPEFFLPPSGVRHPDFPTGNILFPAYGGGVPFFRGVNIIMLKSFGLTITISSLVLAALALASGWVGNYVTGHPALAGVVVGFLVAQLFRARN